jgi:hypothetical protein
MNYWIRIFSILVAGLWSAVLPANAQVNVTQEHNNLSRDGVYVDAAFTASAAANLTRDLGFDGTVSGNVYAQPLYIEGGPNGPMVIAVTESNNIYALDAVTGTISWQRNVGAAVTSGLPCGNINPVGITGTPVVDPASRSLFFDALIDGPTKKHFIFSLNVDTGATNPGWPVDVNATATYNSITFTSLVQEDRGGLALVNGIVYVSYSGYTGIAALITVGWWASISITPPTCMPGRRQRLAVAFGDTAVLPATVQTCLSSQGTLLTRAATGWAAKLSFGCKLVRPGLVSRLTIGRLSTGFPSIIATLTSGVSARR